MSERYLKLATIFLLIVTLGFGWVMYLIAFDKLPRQLEVFVVEEYTPANLVVDVRETQGPMVNSFEAFAQGGEEQFARMLDGTEGHMRQLGPRYIRLDHIFDDDYYGLVSGSSGNLNLDWTRLDQTVDDILEMGAKPFFSLGYMPSALAPSKIDQPYNWGDWQWLVAATIQHYSGTRGIDFVYYEVWNEPDLASFGSWHYGGGKSYITMYDVAARAAANLRTAGVVRPFKFGGPATTALYANWVTALVNHAAVNGLPLDFISWHTYSYLPARFAQEIQDVNSWLGEGHGYELVISEWGPDSEKTPVYGGYYAGAHAAAVARAMIDGLDLGFAFEVKDGPFQDNFGWGLFTHNSAGLAAKPRFWAFAFLSEMGYGERLLLQGEGTNITGWAVRSDEQTKVVVSNFAPGGAGFEEFPVSFEGLPPGQYLLEWQTWFGNNGEQVVSKLNNNQLVTHDFSLEGNDIMKIRLTAVKPFRKQQVTPSLEEVGDSGFGRIIREE